jgi:hypothetical protein
VEKKRIRKGMSASEAPYSEVEEAVKRSIGKKKGHREGKKHFF